MYFQTLFFLLTICDNLFVASTFHITCSVVHSYGQYSVFCNPDREKCCDTGCCDRYSGNNFWYVLWGIFFVFFAIWRYCLKQRCCNDDDTENNTATTVTNNRNSDPQSVQESITAVPIENIFPPTAPSLDLENTYPTAPSVQVEITPVTPPPSYEAATCDPLLRPEDRIPSYEDVMRGKKS